MTLSLIIGSVPAVLVGSLISSSVPDRYIRPVITFVIFASGLKYIGVGTTRSAGSFAPLFAAAVVWLFYARPRQSARAVGEPPPMVLEPPIVVQPAAVEQTGQD